jgi:hypothetical protein
MEVAQWIAAQWSAHHIVWAIYSNNMHLDEPSRDGVGVAIGNRRRRHHLRCRTLGRKKRDSEDKVGGGHGGRVGGGRGGGTPALCRRFHWQRREGARGSSGGIAALEPEGEETTRRHERTSWRPGVAGDTHGSAGFGPDCIQPPLS